MAAKKKIYGEEERQITSISSFLFLSSLEISQVLARQVVSALHVVLRERVLRPDVLAMHRRKSRRDMRDVLIDSFCVGGVLPREGLTAGRAPKGCRPSAETWCPHESVAREASHLRCLHQHGSLLDAGPCWEARAVDSEVVCQSSSRPTTAHSARTFVCSNAAFEPLIGSRI